MSTSLSTPELIKLKFDEVQNIMNDREKNMKMEMAKVVRERDSLKKEMDLLEKSQSSANLEKCSLEEKLCKLEGRCELLDKMIVEMEEKIQRSRREKLDVEKKLKISETKCEDLKRKEIEYERVVQKLKRKNEELRVKKMEADKVAEDYKKRIDYLKSKMLKLKKLTKVLNVNLADLDKSGEEEDVNLCDFVDGDATISPQVPSGGGIGSSNKGASFSATFNRFCDLEIINKIKENLHKENLEIFEQSCFGPLLKIDKLQFQGQLMLQLLWHLDMGASSKEMLVFNINDSNMEFRPNNFFLITGLHVGTLKATKTRTYSSIHRDVFHSSPSIALMDVENAFLNASRENEGRGELTLKLALLYFLYGILLCRNKRVNNNDMKYLHLVEDLEKFNKFPWGQVAYELLVTSILSIRGRMDALEVSKKKFKIFGFSYALQAWAYEVMPSVATYCANNLGNLTPQILCWSATKNFRFNDLNKLFTSGDKAHLNISMDREKSRRVELDELRLEKMKSDEAAQHYKKRLEDLEPDNERKEPEIKGSDASVTRPDGEDGMITISDTDSDDEILDDEIFDFISPYRSPGLSYKRNRGDFLVEDYDSAIECKKRTKPPPAAHCDSESLLHKFNDVNSSDDES